MFDKICYICIAFGLIANFIGQIKLCYSPCLSYEIKNFRGNMEAIREQRQLSAFRNNELIQGLCRWRVTSIIPEKKIKDYMGEEPPISARSFYDSNCRIIISIKRYGTTASWDGKYYLVRKEAYKRIYKKMKNNT